MKALLNETEDKMKKSVARLEHEFTTIRAGRANPAVLEPVVVDYYGVPTPIQQMAAVSVSEARILVIQPWDASTLKAIEKAILASDIGITPTNDGKVLRLVFPQLTEDRRKELCKEIARCGGLDGRVYLALDYFDASVNRIAAWVTGFRNVQKALLNALVTPDMTAEQNAGNFTDLLVRQEELKTMPFGEIWAEYCRRCGVPEDGAWLPLVRAYEKNVLEARA